MHILVIDDEKSQRDILNDILTDAGYSVVVAADGDQGLEYATSGNFDLILTDLKMPGKDGLDVLKGVRDYNPEIQVIIMTAFGTIPGAVNAIKGGASDYLTKPFKKEELLHVVRRTCERGELISENRKLKDEITKRYHYQNIIGKSPAMRDIYKLIERIKDVDATVLISGESGTGKELVARAIHFSSKKSNGPFVAINCGAIPESLIESELFGHEKGSFTGANKSHIGKFEQAQGGTIFLDEIGTMRADLQIKLLRVLQERKVEPIGSHESKELDVRVLAATNDDLEAKVREGSFRTDLYHRLNVFHIRVPRLIDRKEDILLLSNYFINKYTERYNKNQIALTQAAFKALENYAFPGNVRELENIIEKAIILSDGPQIDAADLMIPEATHSIPIVKNEKTKSLPELEEKLIYDALKDNFGSLKRTANTLGITYKTLQYRLKKYGIE
ncbi:MAG: sigma-54 dependent transcriptional regulator [Calditrichaceae bacterium]